jgi:hypothetical protein
MLWELPIRSKCFSHRLGDPSNCSEMVPERAPRQVFHVSAQAEIAIQHQTSKSPNIGFCAQTGDPAFLEILGFLLE